MFPAQMTGLHLVSGRMKRQFIHTAAPRAFNLARKLFVGVKMASLFSEWKEHRCPEIPRATPGLTARKNCAKNDVMLCWWLTVKTNPFVPFIGYSSLPSDLGTVSVRAEHFPICFLTFLNVFFFLFFFFSARWSCGAEQRSAWKKQPKRSLSQEQSATTSCVMWPIGRKSTSKPRWLEKRYTSFYIQRRFPLAQKDSVFAHSEPLHKVRLCDASLSPLLCILALSHSRSHLVYRLHFIWNIWIRAGNIAESSAAAQLCHLTKADRKHTDL